ncbi:MAG TPA: ATP-dependent sacrificial sulfur transferase LarE [Gemmatimonadales bacterium]|nr:ATP-dependent sacrificial sulfur transferase LarE [Gemmatimonadales bacterium]
MPTLSELKEHLAGLGRVLLGYSGGVDSALLAVAARQAVGRDRMLAVIGRSASYPAVQWQAALGLARRFDVPLLELDTHELDDPRYVANPPDRCYFCKTELWTRLGAVAVARGYDVVIDGTNTDDLGEHRPGLRAATERAVRSPLAELGWSKAAVRAAARELGLPTWDAPAAPCLSSRIRYGLAVTSERLAQVEAGEAYLRRLGVSGDLRVRHHGATARLEIAPAHHERIGDCWDEVHAFFQSLGFAGVELDPRGYRRGSLLAVSGDSGR